MRLIESRYSSTPIRVLRLWHVIGIAAAAVVLSATATVAQTEPQTLAEEPGPLAPGTYVDTSTGSSVVFTVGEGWEMSGEPLPGVGTELHLEGSDGLITLTTFAGVVFAEACPVKGRLNKFLRKTTTIDATAEAFIGAMAANKNLEAQDIVETELSGLPALQLDIVSAPGKKCVPMTSFLWELPVVQEFHLDNGAISRIIATDVGGEVVAVVIETPARTRASPFTFLDKAMELVDTIEITPTTP